MGERLFGVPDAENLHFDLADAYEAQIAPWVDEHDQRGWQIEEWTVHPPRDHFPTVDHVIEHIVEWVADCGETDEGFDEHLYAEADRAAVEAMLQAWADRITYRMADERVATHEITWDDDGEPLVDGVPMYGPSRPEEADRGR